MKPSHELDALVAQKVMGWKMAADAVWHGPGPSCLELPRYSTDIAAAWEVVEKMQDTGYRAEIVCGSAGDAYATFVLGGLRHRADTASIPHAICLAALKAVGAL